MVYIVVKDESDDEGDKIELISHVRKNDAWIIQSGLLHQMIGEKTKFEHMEHYDGGSVRFGNNEPCCIKEKGCISLTSELVCDNAYWVEGLKNNLLSVAQLKNIGFKVELMNGKENFLDEKRNLVGFGNQTKGNLFYLYLGESSCVISQVEESQLQNKRLCHVKFDNLIKIRKNKRVKGIPSLRKPDMGLCKNGQIGRMGKTSFKRK